MDINHLRFLIDVAETKSITLSAKRLFISQQGLSQIILRLENDLQVPLLNRHRQGVTLTQAGEVVVQKAQELIEKYEDLLQSVQPYSTVSPQSLSGRLTIGTVPFISINLLPEVLDVFHKQYPAIEVHVQENQPDVIISDIKNCHVDIGLVIVPEDRYNEIILTCNGTYEKFFENEFFAVVAKSSPLAKKKSFTIGDLYQQPIAFYNFESYLNIMTEMFKDLNRLNILVKTNSVELYKNNLLNRHAVGITNSTDTKLLNDNSLAIIPIKDSIRLFYGCFIPSSCTMSAAAKAFMTILKAHVAKLLNRKK